MTKAAAQDSITVPRPIRPGSKIAIVAPASYIYDKYIDGAVEALKARGYRPVVMPHARGKEYGSFAASDPLRAADLMVAFRDPEVDAILCARGGYGTVRLLEMLDTTVIKANPKWLVGFSDITALHAMMTRLGIASIHGPMCSHLTKKEAADTSLVHTFAMLEDSLPMTYTLPPTSFDLPGRAEGRLVGGNLMVANGLAQTEYDILNPADSEGAIIFIEDVGEKIYAIERVLMRLHQSGALNKAKGLIIGEFTNYKPSDDFDSMEAMISYWLRKWGYVSMPVLFGMPSGHGDVNYPLLLGAKASLSVGPEGSVLTMGTDIPPKQ